MLWPILKLTIYLVVAPTGKANIIGHKEWLLFEFPGMFLRPFFLLQEELMYTDAAVDGSSFQLLGDGDLHTYYTQGGVSGVRLNSA